MTRSSIATVIYCALTLSLVLMFVCSLNCKAMAQPSNGKSKTSGITISPSFQEVTLGPGILTADTKTTLANGTTHDVVAKVRFIDFTTLGDLGAISLLDSKNKPPQYALSPWMSSMTGQEIVIPAGQTKTITINIQNSSKLAPGGHYGAAVFTISTPNLSNANVNFKQELVSLYFTKKLGGEKYGLELKSATPDTTNQIPSSIKLRFKSTGNVHVVPRGYIEVIDPSGAVVSKGIINPESTNVLPQTTRQFISLLQTVKPSSQSGKYKINIYYRHDDQKAFQTESQYFTRGIPRGLFLGVIIAVTLLVISVPAYWMSKKVRKSKK